MSFQSPLNHAESLQSELKNFPDASMVVVMKHITKKGFDRAMPMLHIFFPLHKTLTFGGIAAIFYARCF